MTSHLPTVPSSAEPTPAVITWTDQLLHWVQNKQQLTRRKWRLYFLICSRIFSSKRTSVRTRGPIALTSSLSASATMSLSEESMTPSSFFFYKTETEWFKATENSINAISRKSWLTEEPVICSSSSSRAEKTSRKKRKIKSSLLFHLPISISYIHSPLQNQTVYWLFLPLFFPSLR